MTGHRGFAHSELTSLCREIEGSRAIGLLVGGVGRRHSCKRIARRGLSLQKRHYRKSGPRCPKDGCVNSINENVPTWRQRSIIRQVRLCSGLLLFIYISAHLLNHSLGIYSLAWAEDGLLVHKVIWHSTIGTTVLYGAFLVHFALGLFALYARRMLHC